MQSTRLEGVTAPAWTDVLANVHAAIKTAEADAAARENVLAQTAAGVQPKLEEQTAWQECFGRLAQRLERWQREVQRAEQTVWEIDADLQAGEDALKKWSAALEANRQKLATHVADRV
jgi:uncharacterized protein YaaN involved in tellurite resistance